MTVKPANTRTAQEAYVMAGDLDAQVRETHTGVVILLGEKSYKVKKPVITDFLDFSTSVVANMRA